MTRHPPISTRTHTLFPQTPLFRSQGTYASGPHTNSTVGARYTNEKKTSDPNNYFIDIGYGLGPLSIGNPNPNPATIIDTPVAVKFNNVSPMATIDHRW